MISRNKLILTGCILAFYSCNNAQHITKNNKSGQDFSSKNLLKDNLIKIPILNLGTFHMGETNDANKT